MTILYTTGEVLALFPKMPEGAMQLLHPYSKIGNSYAYTLEELEIAEWMEKQFMAGSTVRGMMKLARRLSPFRVGPGCVKNLWS